MEKRIQDYARMKGGKSKGPASATLSIEGRKMNLWTRKNTFRFVSRYNSLLKIRKC